MISFSITAVFRSEKFLKMHCTLQSCCTSYQVSADCHSFSESLAKVYSLFNAIHSVGAACMCFFVLNMWTIWSCQWWRIVPNNRTLKSIISMESTTQDLQSTVSSLNHQLSHLQQDLDNKSKENRDLKELTERQNERLGECQRNIESVTLSWCIWRRWHGNYRREW